MKNWVSQQKSLLTNLIAFGLVVLGYTIHSPVFKDTGYYALSGAITNWLAIYMLFHKIPFLIGSGVIEVQFEEFKAGIKHLVMSQFFSAENLEKFVVQLGPVVKAESLSDALSNKIDADKIFDELKITILGSSFGGVLSMMGGGAALESLRPACVAKLKAISEDLMHDALQTMVPSKDSIAKFMPQLESLLDIRLNELSPQMVKVIIQTMIEKHLGWLVVWGGVLGGLIGVIMHGIESLNY